MKELINKLSNELVLRIGFTLSIGILIMASFFSYLTNRDLISNAQWVDHTSCVIRKMNGMLLTLKDAQLSQKNFLMTNDAKYLTIYYGSRERFHNDFEALQTLTIDNQSQQVHINEIEKLYLAYFDKLDGLIDMKRKQTYIYDPLAGVYEVEMLVQLLNNMKSTELDLWAIRTKKFDDSSANAPIMIVFFSFIALGFAILAYIIINKNIKSIRTKEMSIKEAYEEVQAMNEELSSTNEELRAVNEELNENRDYVQTANNRLVEAQEIANVGNWEWDVASNDIYWSDQLIKMFDHDANNVGKFDYESYLKLLHLEDKHIVDEAVEKILKDHQPYTIEHRIIKKDGSISFILAKGKAIVSSDGTVKKLLGTTFDITELKHAQTEEEKLVAVVDNSSDFIALADLDGNIIFLNPAGRKLVGLTQKQKMSAIRINDFLTPDNQFFLKDHIMPMVNDIGKWSGEVDFIKSDTKELIPVCWSLFSVKDRANNCLGIGHIVQDMRTEKKIRYELQIKNEELSASIEELSQAEDNLMLINRELEARVSERSKDLVISEERFRIVSLATNDAIWDWDLQTDKLWWNEGFKTMFGYKNEQIEPGIESLHNRIHPDDKNRIVKEIRKFLISGKSQWTGEYKFLNSSGKYIDVMERGHAIYNELGKPYRMLGSLINITERKELENDRKKLHELAEHQNQRLYSLLMNIPAAITIMKGKEYVYEMANDRYKSLLGIEGEIIGKSRKDIDPIINFNAVIETLDEIYKTGIPFSKTEFKSNVLKNGKQEIGYFNILFDPIFDNNHQIEGIMTYAVEVTEQVLARQNVEESAQEIKILLEAIPQMTWTSNPNGEADFFNSKWHEYTGASLDDLKGWSWDKYLHPDDKEMTYQKWKDSLNTGNVYDIEYRWLRGVDKSYRWMLGRAVPLKNNAGEIIKWVGTCTDIHDQKIITNDLDNKNQELIKVNELLDTFVYTAAHDLKSPVINLKSLFDLIKETEDSATKDEYFKTIDKAVKRLDDTITGLVEVIDVQSEDHKVAKDIGFEDSLNQVLQDCAPNLDTIGAKVTFDFNQQPSIHYLKSYLNSIFTNLVGNAIKYRSSEKQLVVKIVSYKVDGFVVLEVKDNGIGIDLTKHGNKIFKAFNRFSRNAEGKGLGLYLIKTMVERNGGKLEVESALDLGTTFKMYLKEYN